MTSYGQPTETVRVVIFVLLLYFLFIGALAGSFSAV